MGIAPSAGSRSPRREGGLESRVPGCREDAGQVSDPRIGGVVVDGGVGLGILLLFPDFGAVFGFSASAISMFLSELLMSRW